MRLVEKKCPNCGGALKFGIEDRETHCDYCGKSFEIERDSDKTSKEDLLNADFYSLTEEQKKAATAVVGTFAAMQILPIIFFVIIFIFIVSIGIFAVRHNNSTSKTTSEPNSITYTHEESQEEEPVENEKTKKEVLIEQGYIFEFKELTDAHIKDIHDNTVTILKSKLDWYESFFRSHGKLNYAGMYLLTNDDRGNILYDVYKMAFKGKDFYFGVEYDNVKVIDGKLVVNMDGRIQGGLNSGSKAKDDTFGYEGAKDFFNKVIRGKLSTYKVQISGDVYTE